MKKIVFEIIQVIIAYVIATIYGYYNTPEPDNKYSWLISAIMIIIIYPIIKLAEKKKEKTFDYVDRRDNIKPPPMGARN